MPKIKKVKKTSKIKNKGVKGVVEIDIKSVVVGEEPEKESSTLSDGVLDAFEELAPVDPLSEEEAIIAEVEEEEDELDSGDYKANDEW
jgi:hypothetical protein